jgi:hypothetical protein
VNNVSWLEEKGARFLLLKFWQMICKSSFVLVLKIDAGSCNGTVGFVRAVSQLGKFIKVNE